MKLNHFITNCNTGRVIQEFGGAKLVRRPNGKHELVGGSMADLMAANEWVSLFAHEIVFSRSICQPTLNSQVKSERLSSRFQPAPNHAK
jgi:hypothetical protein